MNFSPNLVSALAADTQSMCRLLVAQLIHTSVRFNLGWYTACSLHRGCLRLLLCLLFKLLQLLQLLQLLLMLINAVLKPSPDFQQLSVHQNRGNGREGREKERKQEREGGGERKQERERQTDRERQRETERETEGNAPNS